MEKGVGSERAKVLGPIKEMTTCNNIEKLISVHVRGRCMPLPTCPCLLRLKIAMPFINFINRASLLSGESNTCGF